MTTENAFHRFWSLGYERLLPITAHGEPVSERSSLIRRPKAMGKVPGVKGEDGLWRSFNWTARETRYADLLGWHNMGAGVGIRLGRGLVAIDIDSLDADLANTCAVAATDMLGQSPNRVGNAPKRLKLYRIDSEIPYRKVEFQGGAVELLTEGKQFVAHGIHPATGRPYEWPSGVPAYDDLPAVTHAQLDAYFDHLASVLPAAEQHVEGPAVARKDIDQATLQGDLDMVRRAVRAIPNDYPDRRDYINVGTAIKAALPDHPDEALDLFLEWADTWPGNENGKNDPDVVEADWQRMHAPFEIGAGFLYHIARRHGDGSFSPAESWFKSSDEICLNAFERQMAAEEAAGPQPEAIAFFDPADAWTDDDPPPRQWEVAGMIPRGEVTLLYGEGGVGKTLLAHQYAICAAAGVKWLGQETRPARVMGVFCEDDEMELRRRHVAIRRLLNVSDPLRGRLRLVSRRGKDNILAHWPRGDFKLSDFYYQLAGEIAAWRPDVVILDTLADIYGGSEIDRAQVNRFVKQVLGSLVEPVGASCLVLGHPSVGGRAEGRSGSTAWSNAARSRLYLRYPDKKETGNLRELEGMKSNYAPKGLRINVRWERGAFVATAASKPGMPADTVAAVVLPSIEDELERKVLAAVAACEREGVPLNLSPRSGAYAPKVFKREHDVPGGLAEIEAAVVALEDRGVIRLRTFPHPERRHKVTGYAVVTEGLAPAATGAGVFA